MKTSITLAGSRIVAAMIPANSKTPFNRGNVIIRASDGVIVRAENYMDDLMVEGSPLTEDQLDALVDTGHAINITGDSVPAETGVSMWVLRRQFPLMELAITELEGSGLLISPLMACGEMGAALALVREDPHYAHGEDTALRELWRVRAMHQAEFHAQQGAWDVAATEAEVAHAISTELDPEVLGLLCEAYSRCGRNERSDGLLVMAQRSRGETFRTRVEQARCRFRNYDR